MARKIVIREIPGIFGRQGKPDALFPVGAVLDTADPAGAKADAAYPTRAV